MVKSTKDTNNVKEVESKPIKKQKNKQTEIQNRRNDDYNIFVNAVYTIGSVPTKEEVIDRKNKYHSSMICTDTNKNSAGVICKKQ